MATQKTKNILLFVGIILLIIGWMMLFRFYSPAEIIEWLGITNAYLVTFLVSAFGAISSTTPFTTYPALYTMAAGGVSPIILVPLAAIGLTTGDLLFVAFGLSARRALSKKIVEKVEQLLSWLNGKPDWFGQISIYVWVGILPLANNLLTAPLAMTGFPVKKMILPLVLGNMTFPLIATALGWFG